MEQARVPFADRDDAGDRLAAALWDYRASGALVLAIPRGGVVVAYRVAVELALELDVIVPRKIRAPDQPELAIGAVASWGGHQRILDDRSLAYLNVPQRYLDEEIRRQFDEVERRLRTYRGTTDPPDIRGRTVLLVDDGIATGHTTRAAALSLRTLEAGHTVLAVPVGPADSVSTMRGYLDEVVCLAAPEPFLAVGYWYQDFAQVSDEEVLTLLERARQRVGGV